MYETGTYGNAGGRKLMVQIIAGIKGNGKTKYLLELVNNAVKEASGNLVYLDKNAKKIHELSNKVRLINVTEYPINNTDQFIGLLCGIMSQDYDLQEMYLDSFLTIGKVADEDIESAVTQLEEISNTFDVKIVLSISKSGDELPESLKEKLIVSL